jgi:hypothetical protein
MSDVHRLIHEVAAGADPRRVFRQALEEDLEPDPVASGPDRGTHPGGTVPPTPEDPLSLYSAALAEGGFGPHAHLATLDPQGNGTTDEEMGSQHAVLRFEIQPDPTDGHTHSLDQGSRRDVPSSLNPAGLDTSFHLLATDPNRFSYE